MSTIKIKRSGTTTQTPSSLEHGELALNYADGKLFYKDASDNIAELSTGGGGGGGLDSAAVISLTGAEEKTSSTSGLEYVVLDKLRVEGGAIGLSTLDASSEIYYYGGATFPLAGNPSGQDTQNLTHNLWSTNKNNVNLTAVNDVYVGSRYAGTKFSYPAMISYAPTSAQFGGGFKWDHAGTQALFLTKDSADFNGTVSAPEFKFSDGTSMTTAPTGGGGTTYSIDETGRDNTGDWIQFASGVGNNQDRVFFKSRDTANTYRGTDAGFQFDGLTSNQAFVMEDGAKGVKFIGYHYETGADEGLEIEGKSGSGTKSTVYLKTNAKTAIKMTDGSVELPSIPTTDPINANEIWSDGGVLVMSGSTAPTGGAGGGLDSAGVQLLIDAEVQDPTTLTLGASSNAGIGIGSGVVTNGLSGGSVSIGTNANSYIQSVAIGSSADASGTGSVSVGPDTQASGNFNTAIGRQATTSGSKSLALGYSSSAGNLGIALGDAASGQRSIAIGALASAPATGALHINANYNSGVGPTADGGLVIETASARLEYSADSDWTFGAGVTMTDLTASGATVIFNNLPVIDPVNAGQLWNDNGTLKVSAG